MNKIILTFFLAVVSPALFAQTDQKSSMPISKHDIGIGGGLDYGGFGTRYTYMHWNKLGVFGSVGYMISGTGYNFGVVYKHPLTTAVTPYVSLMYGTNDATGDFIDEHGVDRIYHGASMGFGVELKGKKSNGNFWNFEFVVPITGTIATSDEDHYFVGPVGLSLGYHFAFN